LSCGHLLVVDPGSGKNKKDVIEGGTAQLEIRDCDTAVLKAPKQIERTDRSISHRYTEPACIDVGHQALDRTDDFQSSGEVGLVGNADL
jgi:hypothetical protein